MKNFLHIITLAIIATACNASKKAIEEKPFDKSIVINDTITVSEGKLISKSKPLVETPKKPEISVNKTKIEIEKPTLEKHPYKDEIEEIPDAIGEGEDEIILTPVKNTTAIHDSWNTLLQQNVTAKGNVNYEGFRKNSSKLREYIATLADNLPQDDWTKNEKLSYWMNAYNAMTVDLILRNMPLESIKDIKNPWEQRNWKLGEKYYNLDEIEHQILRKMGDPRIHFGINCASFSCPPLLNEAFIPSKVDAQLDVVAKKFINDPSRNMLSENSVEISKIFDWFSKDFKNNGSIIDYLNKYSNIKISEDAKVRYMDYDWALNK